MLAAPLLRRRISSRPWTPQCHPRFFSKRKHERPAWRKVGKSERKDEDGSSKDNPPPPLIEQLFPERYGAASKQREEARAVPEIPLDPTPLASTVQRQPNKKRFDYTRDMLEKQDPIISVLILRNASKNLVEEDFRRVIPQGRHMEGWTLEQGDILRVIPGRDLATLEQTGYYMLLFSSPVSAFTYQRHVTRIHRVVAAHTPSSLLSPFAPPPGHLLEGIDTHEAMAAYSLTPPDQTLSLRQLKPPLTPMMASIVRHSGHAALKDRVNRSPFEARLTLEGPQLKIAILRHIFLVSGRERNLPWSGSDDPTPKLSTWTPIEPEDAPSPMNNKYPAMVWARKQEELARRQENPETSESAQESKDEDQVDDQRLAARTPQIVYIVGFATEEALHSFVHFWHGRQMTWQGADKDVGGEEGDLPPLTSVDVLW